MATARETILWRIRRAEVHEFRQVSDARNSAEASEARARAAEASARESDAWAAQMESGLRVAVAKLRAAGQETRDIERAAGTPDEFF